MAVTTKEQPGLTARQRKYLRWAVLYFVMGLISLIFLLPIIWMLSTSFKPKAEWFTRNIEWLPKTFTTENYEKIINNPSTPMLTWFLNSVAIATIATVATLAIDSLAAYAYARLEFPGKRIIYALLLATLFLPGIMFLIPNFMTIYNLKLLNSYAGVILPGLAGVFGVFFLRQFFSTIPKEFEEAAGIDGANPFQIFYLIIIPLARPALATLAIITFLASWNDFLWPLLVLKDRNLQTLPPGLRTLQGAYTSEYGLMMAGAVLVAIPVLVIYIFLQRFIVASVASSGIKG